MSDLLNGLGIEWKILIAQMINFAILFFVVKKFVVGPIIKIIEGREKRIELDRVFSEKLKVKENEINQLKESVLAEARKETVKIIKEAEASSSRLKESIIVDAKKEAESIMSAGLKRVEDERKKAEESLREDIGELVSLAVEKTVAGVLDEHAHQRLIEEAKQYIIDTGNLKR